MTNTLQRLGLKYGTDKSDFDHSHLGRSYLHQYERFFEPVRFAPIKLLEIGVGDGRSLRLWREYFPCASIYGIDIDDKSRSGLPGGCMVERVDQSNAKELQDYAGEHGPFDIVIDDGSHVARDIVTAFDVLWASTKQFYCIEDTACTYRKDWPPLEKKKTNSVNFRSDMDSFLRRMISKIDHKQGDFEAIHFFNMQIIFQR